MSEFETRGTVMTAPPALMPGSRRMVIYADGAFSPLDAKTGVCLVRFVPDEVVAVIDSTRAPSTVEEALGFGGAIPIVPSLEEALRFRPNSLVIGMAPKGGMLPGGAYDVIKRSIENGLHIISGMHQFLGDDSILSSMARDNGVLIWDVRKVPRDLGVSSGMGCSSCSVVMTVGSDCNTGKMTAALEIFSGLVAAGIDASFAATGQTGIMITGRGICIDRVVSDFIGGATETLVRESCRGKDVVLLEGQGSILHPGYIGVTMGMIGGALPHAFILCHQPTRKVIRKFTIKIPPLDRLIELYENAIAGIKGIPVIAIALNTFDMNDGDALKEIESARATTGLPVDDPVRFGTDVIVGAVKDFLGRSE